MWILCFSSCLCSVFRLLVSSDIFDFLCCSFFVRCFLFLLLWQLAMMTPCCRKRSVNYSSTFVVGTWSCRDRVYYSRKRNRNRANIHTQLTGHYKQKQTQLKTRKNIPHILTNNKHNQPIATFTSCLASLIFTFASFVVRVRLIYLCICIYIFFIFEFVWIFIFFVHIIQWVHVEPNPFLPIQMQSI
jgi:hypothetical protein